MHSYILRRLILMVFVILGITLMLFIIMYQLPGDPARIAAGVLIGVGFLGAGIIMRTGEGIVAGLTTAATIWAVAGIGLAAGAGLYLVSAVATVLILIVLYLPHPIR